MKLDLPGNAGVIQLGSPKWDQSPADDIISSGAIQLNDKVRNRVGDIVVYYVDNNANGSYDDGELIDHSALVTKTDKYGNTEEVTGKMGQGELATIIQALQAITMYIPMKMEMQLIKN